MFDKSTLDGSSHLADQVALSAENAIHSTQRATHEALDSLSASVQGLRDQANALVQNGADGMRHTGAAVREQALRATNNTRHYVQAEPVKSILMAAAVGASLMALVSLLSHSGKR